MFSLPFSKQQVILNICLTFYVKSAWIIIPKKSLENRFDFLEDFPLMFHWISDMIFNFYVYQSVWVLRNRIAFVVMLSEYLYTHKLYLLRRFLFYRGFRKWRNFCNKSDYVSVRKKSLKMIDWWIGSIINISALLNFSTLNFLPQETFQWDQSLKRGKWQIFKRPI